MNKVAALRKEIKDILSRPHPWGPMMMPRVISALRIADDFMNVIQDLEESVKYYEQMRSDVKLSRNMTILKMHEKGMSYSIIAKQFGLSRQRIYKIVSMTKKYLEESNGTRTQGLSGKSDSISAA